jgi:hypothetical protein
VPFADPVLRDCQNLFFGSFLRGRTYDWKHDANWSAMLIRFSVENFRSINNRAELSLVAQDKDFPASRAVTGLDEQLLTLVGIFGPNASGKSNILAAIQWLRDAVVRSLRTWDEGIPVDQFLFGPAAGSTTAFEIEYVIDGVRFDYQLEVTAEEILYEGLFHYPLGRRRRVFERNRLELVLQDGLGSLSGARKLLTPRSLMLSIARRFREELTLSFANKIAGIDSLGLPRNRRFFGGGGGPAYLGARPRDRWFVQPEMDDPDTDVDDEEFDVGRENDFDIAAKARDQGLALLQMADLGIVDVQEVQDESALARGASVSAARRTQFIHTSGNEKYPLDMSEESAGTRTWFRLVGPVLDALRNGDVLIFDEIDASLHPRLSAELLGLFASPSTNPKNAQLIFTSHDASLLARLNRDQVWLTEKNALGASELVPLTDFGGDRVRRSQNLEKAYLEGRFGGIPDVDLVTVYRALGLMS